MKSVLLFLAGLLVGANLVYYWMSRHPPEAASAAPAVVARGAAPAASAPSPALPSALPSAPAATPGTAASAASTTLPPAAVGPHGLAIPVQGITAAQLSDTFNDRRGSERIHEALDIMAPAGTPVVAVADGTVAKLFNSDAGGLTLYQFDPTSTYAYYYAHLQGYAPGIAEGQSLRRGQVIGYVGSTGNADPAGPHLHFAIFLLGPEKQWWKGSPVNPYPLLR